MGIQKEKTRVMALHACQSPRAAVDFRLDGVGGWLTAIGTGVPEDVADRLMADFGARVVEMRISRRSPVQQLTRPTDAEGYMPQAPAPLS